MKQAKTDLQDNLFQTWKTIKPARDITERHNVFKINPNMSKYQSN